MKIKSYNPANMQQISDNITGIDFENVVRGNHNDTAVVLKPEAEGGETLSALALFLENNADMDRSEFGKYKSSVATQGITPGSDYLSDYFVETPGVSDFTDFATLSDNGVVFSAGSPEYVWLDVEVGTTETILGAQTVNYRFIFEYS